MSSLQRAVLILVVSEILAVTGSVSIIYLADYFVAGFSARADNYILGIVIPLCVAPLLIYPLVHVNYRMERVKAELERMARTDPLTGLPNRRAFFETAAEIFGSADAGTAPLTVMMADIDHFKQINDRHGHAAGDAILRQVAARIASAAGDLPEGCRAFAARLGGEEFVILLAGADRKTAARIADRICSAVRRSQVKLDSAICSATISIGLAFRAPGASLDEVMKAADEAGYDAKRLGRDRWHVAGMAACSPDEEFDMSVLSRHGAPRAA